MFTNRLNNNDNIYICHTIYRYNNFNKYDSFWISALYLLFIFVVVYLALRAPNSQLHWVALNIENDGVNDDDEHNSGLDSQSNSSSVLSPFFSSKSYSFTYAPKLINLITHDVQSFGICLVFKNIHYSVDLKSKSLFFKEPTTTVKLLNDVSGVVNSGELCALMVSKHD
jgi:hypothetical protein